MSFHQSIYNRTKYPEEYSADGKERPQWDTCQNRWLVEHIIYLPGVKCIDRDRGLYSLPYSALVTLISKLACSTSRIADKCYELYQEITEHEYQMEDTSNNDKEVVPTTYMLKRIMTKAHRRNEMFLEAQDGDLESIVTYWLEKMFDVLATYETGDELIYEAG